jgi:regulator of microtubule dynamics protein 3
VPLRFGRSLILAACLAVPVRLASQVNQIASGIHAYDLHDFATARKDFEAVLHQNPRSYEANWRLALVLIDIAKQTPDRLKSPARDSLYVEAESYAHRAVAAKPDGPEGHFTLANAVARGALSKGTKERIRRASVIRNEALRVIELDPHHDGAWHILGRWNAEIMRLPAIDRFVAKTFLGASVFSAASWDEAERDLRLAVQYAPNIIVHRLDLADVLISRQEWQAAKQQLEAVATLPIMDVSDTSYKRQARERLPKVLEKLSR